MRFLDSIKIDDEEFMDKRTLLNFLNVIGSKLHRQITLVAAGGTAMTLLDLKNSTIDIDFTGPNDDIEEFNLVQKMVPHGYKIDTWIDGRVYAPQLPDDYLDKSTIISDTGIKNIVLRSLNPLDIVLTKLARMNERDKEDIQTCILKYGLTEKEIRDRGKIVASLYPANENVYLDNLEIVIKKYIIK